MEYVAIALLIGFICVMAYKLGKFSDTPPQEEEYNGEQSLAVIVHKFITPKGQVGWMHATGTAMYIPISIYKDEKVSFVDIRSVVFMYSKSKLNNLCLVDLLAKDFKDSFSIPKKHVAPLVEWLKKNDMKKIVIKNEENA